MSETELLTEIAIMLFQKERFTLGQASRFARMSHFFVGWVERSGTQHLRS